jgi:C1A family cysteine protease/PKD repeat protein
MPIGAQFTGASEAGPIVNASNSSSANTLNNSIPVQQSTNSTGTQSLISAPLNPQFVKYQESLNYTVRSSNNALSMSSALINSKAELQTGYIPGPVDLSYLKGEQITPDDDINSQFQAQSAYPVSYDLRSLGRVTPVEDQGTSGCCWAFATYGSLESYLLPGETWDFSENNLKNTAGFDLDPNSGGGNQIMSTAYLVRWSGPVAAQDDPYNPDSIWSPTNLSVQQHVQNVMFIPDRNNSTDNSNIKWALENYGAVYTTIFATAGIEGSYNDSYYNASTNSYYYTITNSGNNHAVAIVGWDDNYSKNNFSTPPPGNGAFIVKNSWGADWGDSGYFYVSYYDTSIGSDNAVFTSESVSNYDNIYQYDPLGWTNGIGFSNSDSAWFANVFVASSNQQLASVGFYIPQINSQYTIYIYNGSITSKNLLESQSGSMQIPGYYTIPLNSGISLNSGQSFCIEVNLTTPGYTYPISAEGPIQGYSSNATANASESWVSPNGQTWTDLTTAYQNTNVCLKAYTNDIVGIEPRSLNVSEGCTGNYSIVLRSQPKSTVIVTILNDSLVNVNGTSAVFNQSNWSVPKYIAVTAVDDNLSVGNITDVIAHSASSSDPYYNKVRVDNLTVNIASNDTEQQTLPPQANFVSNVTAGSAPLVVQFNDTSTGNNITSWQWNFGDGSTNATTRAPIHIFVNNSSPDATYTVTLTVTNAEGNSTKQVVNYITVAQRYNITISLVSGWNLISVPLIPSNNSVEEFFPSSVRSEIEDMWGWDASAENWTYYSSDPNSPYWYFPHIETLAAGEGYWLNMNDNASFTITGTIPAGAPNETVPLIAGEWNLVGLTGINQTALSAMYPTAWDMWGWNSTAQNWTYYSSDQNSPYWVFEHIMTVQPGQGYWVNMPEN